ncbi:polyprenyl synthetase family protein [Streptomyces sp. S.PNR 29]|uniref:polyprenyl synthetase family protein n=1 Tax=Streptomyces sp. S.PNR 29 TaxID=2973805 RepID=UPI0025B06D25|nr:polyprenyl synthetase family protein [Streptomyces sp. S.PNR 29]MDN0197965.1 polyprenyl synthetase family protein [Streptomyces sp. S.PNR 29]
MTTAPCEHDAWELLSRARQLTEPALRKAVDRLPERTRAVAEYHFGFRDENGNPSAGDWGKGVRGALVLASAQAMGVAAEQAVTAAAGIELVHNFSLLHDDLMDRDALRRGRRTVWSLFGDAQAVLTGDALLVIAMEVLAEEPAMLQELCSALLCLVAGQSEDCDFEQRTDVALTECLAMAAGKTAALLSSACVLGAMAAHASPARTNALRRFGHHLGLTFQLVDDLLGIWGHTAVSGKPVGADLRRRKKSLPVVAALSADSAHAHRLAELYRRSDEPMGEEEIGEAALLVERAGGRAWAEQEAERQRTQALAALAAADPAPEGAHALTLLAEAVTRRRW